MLGGVLAASGLWGWARNLLQITADLDGLVGMLECTKRVIQWMHTSDIAMWLPPVLVAVGMLLIWLDLRSRHSEVSVGSTPALPSPWVARPRVDPAPASGQGEVQTDVRLRVGPIDVSAESNAQVYGCRYT